MRIFGRYRTFGTGRILLRPTKSVTLPPIDPPIDPPVDTTVPVAFTTPSGNLGTALGSEPFMFTLVASGDDPVFTLESGSALPAGLTLFDDGIIYGTATGISETVSFTVRVSNKKNAVTRVFSITVQAVPQWQTDPELGEFAQGESFRRTVEASSPNGPVMEYRLMGPMVQNLSAAGNPLGGNPDLPETLSFNSATGQISGYYVSQDPEAPRFQTAAGLLGSANRNSAVSFLINALPGTGRTIMSYSPAGRSVLPAGLGIALLANGAATISGTVELYASDALSAPEPVTPVPTWSANAALLDTLTTFSPGVKTFTLSATPNLGTSVSYMLRRGSYLPAGFEMTSAGVVTGTLDRISHLRNPFEPFATMTWMTAAGSLGTAKNGTAINIPLAVTPASGSAVSFFLVRGALPFGTEVVLVSNSQGTASIVGTADAVPGVGTLTEAKTFTFTIRVTDNLGGVSDRQFSYTITP